VYVVMNLAHVDAEL